MAATIEQSVRFPATARELFDLYVSPKHHAEPNLNHANAERFGESGFALPGDCQVCEKSIAGTGFLCKDLISTRAVDAHGRGTHQDARPARQGRESVHQVSRTIHPACIQPALDFRSPALCDRLSRQVKDGVSIGQTFRGRLARGIPLRECKGLNRLTSQHMELVTGSV